MGHRSSEDPLHRRLALDSRTAEHPDCRSGDSHACDERRHYPLYDPGFEHDSCGTGFVADVAGKRSHAVVERAMEALANLAHRGAMDADAETSDGAGVLTQVPNRLLADWLQEQGGEFPPPGELVVGMVFLPWDAAEADVCREALVAALERRGAPVLGWRDVPVSPVALGASARGRARASRRSSRGAPWERTPRRPSDSCTSPARKPSAR